MERILKIVDKLSLWWSKRRGIDTSAKLLKSGTTEDGKKAFESIGSVDLSEATEEDLKQFYTYSKSVKIAINGYEFIVGAGSEPMVHMHEIIKAMHERKKQEQIDSAKKAREETKEAVK